MSEEGLFKKRLFAYLQKIENNPDELVEKAEILVWLEDAKNDIYQEMPKDLCLIELTKQINEIEPEASRVVRLWCKIWKWFGKAEEVTK